MGAEFKVACLVAVLAGACGGDKRARPVAQPRLETVAPDSEAGDRLGQAAVPGFLRACETRAAGAGLIELSCAEHQLVEFRKLEAAGTGGDDHDLDDLMNVMRTRFGELEEEERSSARIDTSPVRLSHFRPADAAGVHGVAAMIGNVEGHYWGLVCYRKGKAVSEDFCGDAVATAARAGGLAHVGARAMQEFGDGKLVVADGCESSPGRGISCAAGKLSWSATGTDALTLRQETAENLRSMAQKEKMSFDASEKSCALLGVEADCQWIRVSNPKESEELNFVLVTGGGQERLVVCTFPGPLDSNSDLPEPCGQAITVQNP